ADQLFGQATETFNKELFSIKLTTALDDASVDRALGSATADDAFRELVGFADRISDGVLRAEVVYIKCLCDARSAAASCVRYLRQGLLTQEAVELFVTLDAQISAYSAHVRAATLDR
ncbi:unnamed protein product, partial [Prorocentrum cordatum]